MPIYDFVCQQCHTKSSILVKNIAEPFNPRCSTCGGDDVIRAITSFAYHKSTKTIWEESGEPRSLPSPDYYQDPRNIGRSTEKRFKELGFELPTQIEEQIQAAREGELPASVKEKL